ncbi:MAG: DUF2341 domain-containing protein, partial [Candidatus Aenigmarchaeota archaeon]|nr:DUF2341 domain-containing protein [Candidatus Aenigmarchaeota archaeon]
MIGKKAVSPLIAVVLLIVFTVAVGTLIASWLYEYTKSTTDAASSGTTGPKGITYCANSIVDISNVNIRNTPVTVNNSVAFGTVNYFNLTGIAGTPTITFTGRANFSLTDGLVGWWHFDENTGSEVADSSGAGNDGTRNGAAWNSTGKFNSALQFDGLCDYVEIADDASLDITDAITVEGWVNPSSDGWKYKRPITLSPTTPETNYQIKVELTTSNFDYSKANADGNDTRFYETNGTELDYWIENWNITGTSTIWVEVATNNIGTIYMYYGNPTASSASSGTNTFEFFDDFEDGNLDGWDELGGTCIPSISNKWSSGGGRYSVFISISQGIGKEFALPNVRILADVNITSVHRNGVYTTPTNQFISQAVGTTYNWESNTIVSSSYNLIFWEHSTGPDAKLLAYIDRIRLRKYTSPEPSVSPGGTVISSYTPAKQLHIQDERGASYKQSYPYLQKSRTLNASATLSSTDGVGGVR